MFACSDRMAPALHQQGRAEDDHGDGNQDARVHARERDDRENDSGDPADGVGEAAEVGGAPFADSLGLRH